MKHLHIFYRINVVNLLFTFILIGLSQKISFSQGLAYHEKSSLSSVRYPDCTEPEDIEFVTLSSNHE